MKIGFRVLSGDIVVFGVDDSGDPLPPDIGTKGYRALCEIALKRAKAEISEVDPSKGKLTHLIDSAQSNPDGFLPDGLYVIEIPGSDIKSGLYLYDSGGTRLLGPVQDSADIVMAIARQSRQNLS